MAVRKMNVHDDKDVLFMLFSVIFENAYRKSSFGVVHLE
jgi:hypothetical protein